MLVRRSKRPKSPHSIAQRVRVLLLEPCVFITILDGPFDVEPLEE